MATNDFVPFATAGGANVLSQSAYLANSQTTAGQQPGIASSALNNKALRQATSIAAAIAQYMANVTGNNVLDDGNQSELLTTIAQAFGSQIPAVTTVLTTGSGNYSIPAGTNYLRITGVAGGGAAAGSNLSPGAGANGTATSLGSLISASGGGGSTTAYGSGTLGVGGVVTYTPTSGLQIVRNVSGASGQVTSVPGGGIDVAGGAGGVSPFGGTFSTGGNTGSGGTGSYSSNGGSAYAGYGGAAGALFEIILSGTALSAFSGTIPYVVGSGGVSAGDGGPGDKGRLIFEAY